MAEKNLHRPHHQLNSFWRPKSFKEALCKQLTLICIVQYKYFLAFYFIFIVSTTAHSTSLTRLRLAVNPNYFFFVTRNA